MADSSERKVFRGTVIIVLVGIASKAAAFLSEAILAAVLGTTYKSDAYYMVSSIQQVVYPMLSIGVWKVFLPLYKQYQSTGDNKNADELADTTITFFSMVSLLAVFLIEVFANIIVGIVAPGFEGEIKNLCIWLVRLSGPMYVFILAAAVYASMLQCHNKFFGSQVREVATHIPTVIAALLLYRSYGIDALAIALVAGGVVRLLVELPYVDWGYRYKVNIAFREPTFLLLIKRLPSALVSEGIVQLNPLVDKSMASMVGEGVISSLNYGNRLTNVFSGLLSSSIATALYPQMVELIALKDIDGVSRILRKIISLFCVVMVPVSIASCLFSTEIVSVVFKRGSFDEESTIVVAGIFACYSIGLLFVACNTVFNNMFYGFGDTNTPMVVSLTNVILNFIFNIAFMKLWGVNGLALSTSATAMICFAIRLILSRRYISLSARELAIAFGKVSISSVIACFAARVIATNVSSVRLFRLLIGVIVGIITYFPLIELLKLEVVHDLRMILVRRLKKR